LLTLETFAALARGPWLAFLAIASHWQLREECYPSQATIAALLKEDERSVRRYVGILVAGGFLAVRRERWRDGSEHLYYRPGPVALAALDAFAARYPRGEDAPRAKALRPLPPPPDRGSGGPPDRGSAEPNQHTKQNFLCSEAERPLSPPALPEVPRPTRAPAGLEEEVTTSRVAEDPRGASTPLREVAIELLAARFARKHPGVPAPRPHVREVTIVLSRLRELRGSTEERRQTGLDAIAGAWARSVDAPSVAYVFGSYEWFLDHAQRGAAEGARERRRLASRARTTQIAQAQEPVMSAAELAAAAAAALEALS
jgi:hypothetical protein